MQKNALFFKQFDKKKRAMKVKDNSKFASILRLSHNAENKKPVHNWLHERIRTSLKQRQMFRKSPDLQDVVLSSQEKLEICKESPLSVISESNKGDYNNDDNSMAGV